MKNRIIIYTDGGARGNPGPAAIGVVMEINGDVREYGEAIGETTNNAVEYKAIIFALKKVKALLGSEKAGKTKIEIRSDSELIVNQQNGKYQVKEESLKPLFIDVWNLRQEFNDVSFVAIKREENKRADTLVNRALDTLF